jgi:hypothetical protein
VTLLEVQIAIVIAAVLLLGVATGIVVPMAEITKQTLQDQSLAGDIDAAISNLGNLTSQGMAAGTRLFIIYNSSGAACTDGTAGVQLYVPYASSSNDVDISLLNGALIATQAGQTNTIVPAGVTSISFTAAMCGSPAVRSGAVLCSLSFLNQGNTYTYSTTLLPRNR